MIFPEISCPGAARPDISCDVSSCLEGHCIALLTSGAGLVNVWCWSGAGLVSVWCWSGECLVNVWCFSGEYQVWRFPGECLVNVWGWSGECLVLVRCSSGECLAQVWRWSGECPALVWWALNSPVDWPGGCQMRPEVPGAPCGY